MKNSVNLQEASTTTNCAKRKDYIDALRGLAMLIVVYGHCLLEKSRVDYAAYFVFTSPWNVALFFTISGYLFKIKGRSFLSFFKYIIMRLVVPWLVLGLFPYYNSIERLPLLLSGETLWFMPALIIGEMIWYIINKVCKEKVQWTVLCGLCCTVIGLVMYRLGLLNYAMVNRAFAIQWLFVIGCLIRNYEDIIVEKAKVFISFCFVLYIGLGVAFLLMYPNEFYDVHLNRYYCLPITWSLIISGIILVFMIARRISKFPKWLVLVGQNTLIIYILHGYGRLAFSKLLSFIPRPSSIGYPMIAVLETAFACAVCLLLGLIAQKYMPWIVGQKRMK